ncbi:hypothetical protein KCP71_05485 [Salmonella enterica subsp. enterica]|nr:hypothetical protein KCP71_05485 [Salmonella enterica subsp. enterica]
MTNTILGPDEVTLHGVPPELIIDSSGADGDSIIFRAYKVWVRRRRKPCFRDWAASIRCTPSRKNCRSHFAAPKRWPVISAE